MTINFSALRIAAICLVAVSAPGWAGETSTCTGPIGRSRLMCDEGACIRVPVKDLCDAVRASYPMKRRLPKPIPVEVDPVRHQLTLLIASVS